MLKINFQMDLIKDLPGQINKATKNILRREAQLLAAQAHAKIVEHVQSKLHSTRELYLKALTLKQERKGGGLAYVISLSDKDRWLDDGLDEHEMIDDMLRKNSKSSSDGSRYRVIPFQHSKTPSSQTPAQKDLTDTIKQEMRQMGIDYRKLETDKSGAPKLGVLHRFDIMNHPLKTANTAGQGWGPIGSVRQGPTGHPFLQGVTITQRAVQTRGGKTAVQRSAMTFRTVSSKHRGTGRWVYPGLKPRNFFDEVQRWAENEWEFKIKPQVLKQIIKVI